MIHAFAELPNEKIVIAGTGSQLEEYKKIATNNMKFVGFLDRNELIKYLLDAKAIIVPSQCYETFGMIIVEAYAAHKPVIVGNIGNIASLVENGLTGLYFEYNCAKSLKNTIRKFENMNTKEMEVNAYKKYKTEFTNEINYSILRLIYNVVKNK